ncbi:HPr kinase/phosphorylase [Sphingosinicella sp. BN140058]|uniref:HPr kinase/phosphorylase n=1 Tax=Sphingosinicella sp. BN140058 TaxID=1892855 RepID=UPI001011D1F8|nr:aldolase [Sphingosinicella sp. BN140058]QAY79176.1 aldolase [Sphingosinicella sp. BN140058]
MTEALVHASTVAIRGRAVLIAGRSGSGKSDLALRLIDRGAILVSDDYTRLCASGSTLHASAPEQIAGKFEIRGIGIVEQPTIADAPVALVVDLDRDPERMPAAVTRSFCGIEIPLIGLSALEASAPIKVESALLRFGLSHP